MDEDEAVITETKKGEELDQKRVLELVSWRSLVTTGEALQGRSGRGVSSIALPRACGSLCSALAHHPCHLLSFNSGYHIALWFDGLSRASLLSDQVFPPTCNIGKNFLSLNYLAEYLQPKAAEGCVISSQPQDKEVHIIELITPNSNPYR